MSLPERRSTSQQTPTAALKYSHEEHEGHEVRTSGVLNMMMTRRDAVAAFALFAEMLAFDRDAGGA